MATNPIAKTEDNSQQVEPAADNAGMMAMIERAASNPDVDIDKMERLLAMQERFIERQAKSDFTAAKIAMQPMLPHITMKGVIVIKKKGTDEVIQSTPYARFEDIHEAVMPILHEYGFDLKFKNHTTEVGKPVVTTILEHVGGHSDSTEFELPMDTSGSKNNVQAIGSSTSYGKRYGALAILNLRVHGEDDDAQTETLEYVRADQPFVTGPAKNKTTLKDMGRALGLEISDIEDTDSLDIFLRSKDTGALIDQLKTNLPLWWHGDGEQKGISGVIQQKQAELRLAGQ